MNPFAELSEFIPAGVMQAYVIIMFLLVIGGTLIDVWHKKSAEFFFENAKNAQAAADKPLSSGEKSSIAMKTIAEDVLTSAEFCNPKRRIAHLLTMYGFLLFVISTVVLVFFYASPDAATPALWGLLWHVGALMVCIGGFWFWFFIRADVSAEGHPWNRIIRADLFILSLVGTAAFGFLWSVFQELDSNFLNPFFLVLFIVASAVLFGGVLWSKFAHMFFKPVAAYQKRVAVADGTMDNLPRPADRTNPEDRDRHSMELLKDAPLDMGPGIEREEPQHY